jgi:hypothetical protein
MGVAPVIKDPSLRPDPGKCPADYDLAAFNFAPRYRDPQLQYAAQFIVGLTMNTSIAQARRSVSSGQVAYDMTVEQVAAYERSIQLSLESARQLSTGNGDLYSQIKAGLPGDYNCGGSASTAVCNAQTLYWNALIAKQIAEGIKCRW